MGIYAAMDIEVGVLAQQVPRALLSSSSDEPRISSFPASVLDGAFDYLIGELVACDFDVE